MTDAVDITEDVLASLRKQAQGLAQSMSMMLMERQQEGHSWTFDETRERDNEFIRLGRRARNTDTLIERVYTGSWLKAATIV